MKGFLNFVREQGVAGLAVGFILGSAISKLVASLVTDIINPILGLFLGAVGGLKGAYFRIGSAMVMWGNFIGNLVDFLVIAFVVYCGVKTLKLDKKKEK